MRVTKDSVTLLPCFYFVEVSKNHILFFLALLRELLEIFEIMCVQWMLLIEMVYMHGEGCF